MATKVAAAALKNLKSADRPIPPFRTKRRTSPLLTVIFLEVTDRRFICCYRHRLESAENYG